MEPFWPQGDSPTALLVEPGMKPPRPLTPIPVSSGYVGTEHLSVPGVLLVLLAYRERCLEPSEPRGSEGGQTSKQAPRPTSPTPGSSPAGEDATRTTVSGYMRPQTTEAASEWMAREDSTRQKAPRCCLQATVERSAKSSLDLHWLEDNHAMLRRFLHRCSRTKGDVLAASGAEIRPMAPTAWAHGW